MGAILLINKYISVVCIIMYFCCMLYCRKPTAHGGHQIDFHQSDKS